MKYRFQKLFDQESSCWVATWLDQDGHCAVVEAGSEEELAAEAVAAVRGLLELDEDPEVVFV